MSMNKLYDDDNDDVDTNTSLIKLNKILWLINSQTMHGNYVMLKK